MSLGRFVDCLADGQSASRLILISHSGQIAAAEPGLLVAGDWLTWRRAVKAGRKCIHFEGHLRQWPEERGDAAGFPDRAMAWLPVGEADPTMFAGQSLGHLFTRQSCLAANAYERLLIGLVRLVRQANAAEVVVHGLRTEYDILGPRLLDHLLAQVAAITTVTVLHRPIPSAPGPAAFSDHGDSYVVAEPRRGWRDYLRDGFALAADLLTRRGARCRPPVYFLQNPIFLRAILGGPVAEGVVPVLPAQSLPKTMATLRAMWGRGIHAATLPTGTLDAADRACLQRIAADLRTAWAAQPPDGPLASAMRLFAEESFLPSLPGLAVEAKRYQTLMQRLRPAAVVGGDATNTGTRACMAAAHGQGARIYELLNGIFLAPLRYDSRRNLVRRQLTWGPMVERWAAVAAPESMVLRTGYPTLDGLPSLPPGPLVPRHALVLPLYVDADDLGGLQADVFAWLAETVELLLQRGLKVRVKVHGGPPNVAYYRAVLAEEGLGDVQVIQAGPLLPHLEWADLVVGPVNSGAMAETLVAGRPYYAIAQQPSTCDLNLLAPLPVALSPAELTTHLDDGHALEPVAALQHLCARTDLPQALPRLWQVLEQDLARG